MCEAWPDDEDQNERDIEQARQTLLSRSSLAPRFDVEEVSGRGGAFPDRYLQRFTPRYEGADFGPEPSYTAIRYGAYEIVEDPLEDMDPETRARISALVAEGMHKDAAALFEKCLVGEGERTPEAISKYDLLKGLRLPAHRSGDVLIIDDPLKPEGPGFQSKKQATRAAFMHLNAPCGGRVGSSTRSPSDRAILPTPETAPSGEAIIPGAFMSHWRLATVEEISLLTAEDLAERGVIGDFRIEDSPDGDGVIVHKLIKRVPLTVKKPPV